VGGPWGIATVSWSSENSSYTWALLACLALTGSVAWGSWRRRKVPGARPLFVLSIISAVWCVSVAGEIEAVSYATRVLWADFHLALALPVATAATWFALAYAGLGRFLTTRNLFLMGMVPLFALVLVFAGPWGPEWRWLPPDPLLQLGTDTPVSIFMLYGMCLVLVDFAVLIWLFVRSPGHRWPTALILIGQFGSWTYYALLVIQTNVTVPSRLFLLFIAPFVTYLLVLYRFRVFDAAPAARAAVIERMDEGMLVLDLEGHIVKANPAAEGILQISAEELRGRSLADVLPVQDPPWPQKASRQHLELSLGDGSRERHFTANLTPLADSRHVLLGHLVLIHDVTDEKRAQGELLMQQRVVATLQERERLARELHDGIGQVLGYISLEAQTIRRWSLDGNTKKAARQLGRLARVAQDAHADVRDSILSLRAGSSEHWSFLPSVRRYLEDYRHAYGIHTELTIGEEMRNTGLPAEIGVQLLRVLQEALTNARRHGKAREIRVDIRGEHEEARIMISDDGCGFDAGELTEDGHYGLGFMEERMKQVNGSVSVESGPRGGTIVTLAVPIAREGEPTQ